MVVLTRDVSLHCRTWGGDAGNGGCQFPRPRASAVASAEHYKLSVCSFSSSLPEKFIFQKEKYTMWHSASLYLILHNRQQELLTGSPAEHAGGGEAWRSHESVGPGRTRREVWSPKAHRQS